MKTLRSSHQAFTSGYKLSFFILALCIAIGSCMGLFFRYVH